MKTLAAAAIAAASLFLASCASTPDAAPKAVELFNGKNLDGWTYFLVDDAVQMEDVWSVRDGLLVCKGEPLGYLLTEDSFQDYRLQLEWRWAPGTKPGNSGVLLRIAGDAVSFLPRCVEAQLQSGSAGDIWAFYGANVDGDADRLREIKGNEALGDFRGIGKIQAAENPPGEWNAYDIVVSGGDLELRVNGTLVNQATGMDVVAGPVGLQSEGGEVHFRNIRLTPR